uniref:Dynein light chain n=1 Tax=Panagrolaimus sp. PS1159 TaxID=55785 RepID=A0AC35FF02_9BILA
MENCGVVIKNSDMPDEMIETAIECTSQAFKKFNVERHIAHHIKQTFDKRYNPTWHCIVGRSFGSFVSHENQHFIYFYYGNLAILLFKSG